MTGGASVSCGSLGERARQRLRGAENVIFEQRDRRIDIPLA
jgi:hypothetical protein